MKPFLLFISSLLLVVVSHAQILSFNFQGIAGNEEEISSNSNHLDIQSSIISRGSGLTPREKINRFSASSWGDDSIQASLDDNRYMEFYITPNAGYEISVSSISFRLNRSATGPDSIALRSSIDNYSTNLDQIYTVVDNTDPQVFTFTFSHILQEKTTYRIICSAESNLGTGGFGDDGDEDDIVINGSVGSIPSASQIIIARNCDPEGNYSPDRFAEIYNAGALALDITGWTLENVQDGEVKFSWTFSGSIAAGETWVCARAYTTGQTISPDVTATWVGAGWNGEISDGTRLKNSAKAVVDDAVLPNGASGNFTNGQMKRKLDVITSSSTFDENEWEFVPTVINANDVLPGEHGSVWLNSSTTWGTASNWDAGVPTEITDAYIIAGDKAPNINDPAECKNLSVKTGASLEVPVDEWLSVKGDLSVDGHLTIKSNASGDGSLIVEGSISGGLYVERYITPYTSIGADDGWHLLSSPLAANLELVGSDFAPTVNQDDIYTWSESAYKWQNYFGVANPTFDFEPGKGYLVAYKDVSPTRVFSGQVNNSDLNISNLSLTNNSAEPENNGWHLLGNPFTSDIRWDDGEWNLVNVNSIAKIFNESSGNYEGIEKNERIPMNQGFFVQVNGAPGSLTIPLSSRVHDNTDWYKNDEMEDEVLKLKLSGGDNSFYDRTKIRFSELASDDFDPKYDSYKMYGMPSAPQLASIMNSEELSTNSLAFSIGERIIPLAFQVASNGNYSISVDENTISSMGDVYLEDRNNNQMIHLSHQQNYDFYANVDEGNDRFVLHFNGISSVENITEQSPIKVYNQGNKIYIINEQNLSAQILVYQMNASLVHQYNTTGIGLDQFTLKTSSGVYLVKVHTEKGVFTQKIVIQ